MKVLVMLKSPVLSDVAVTAHSCLHDGTRFQITQNGLPSVELDSNQVLGLLSALNEHFKVDPPKNGQFEFIDCGPIAPKDGPPGDPVALLCAAAREWAKWDAREQAAIDESDMSVFNFASKKALRYRDRTLSYGRRLLSAGVPVKPADRECCVELSPAFQPEINRLDALVQQLRARVANLEEAGG